MTCLKLTNKTLEQGVKYVQCEKNGGMREGNFAAAIEGRVTKSLQKILKKCIKLRYVFIKFVSVILQIYIFYFFTINIYTFETKITTTKYV